MGLNNPASELSFVQEGTSDLASGATGRLCHLASCSNERSKAQRHGRQPWRAQERVEIPKGFRQCATASPSRTILVTGSAMTAAVMATNWADQSRPLRLHSRTMSPSLCATIREAVVLQLVDLLLASRDLKGEDGLAGADKAGWLPPFPGERRTHQHRRPVTYTLSRVPETVWRARGCA
jgi:hypothetical protein